jgi:hypothetical protein
MPAGGCFTFKVPLSRAYWNVFLSFCVIGHFLHLLCRLFLQKYIMKNNNLDLCLLRLSRWHIICNMLNGISPKRDCDSKGNVDERKSNPGTPRHHGPDAGGVRPPPGCHPLHGEPMGEQQGGTQPTRHPAASKRCFTKTESELIRHGTRVPRGFRGRGGEGRNHHRSTGSRIP